MVGGGEERADVVGEEPVESQVFSFLVSFFSLFFNQIIAKVAPERRGMGRGGGVHATGQRKKKGCGYMRGKASR